MVFTTWLRLNSENYRDVKVKKKPSWVGRNFENLSRNLKTLANNWGNCISVKTSVKYKASRSLLDVNFQAAFARQTASLGDSISTQLCLHSRLSPLFLENTWVSLSSWTGRDFILLWHETWKKRKMHSAKCAKKVRTEKVQNLLILWLENTSLRVFLLTVERLWTVFSSKCHNTMQFLWNLCTEKDVNE